jgi:Fe2+ transport system protein FeoA
MYLCELKKGEQAKILAVLAGGELKKRFLSFGIEKGETIKVREISLGKSTYEVTINNTNVALRLEEAAMIGVEKL